MKIIFSIFFFFLFNCASTQEYTLNEIEKLKINADYIVQNKSEFLKALESVKKYGTVYVKGNVDINLSGQKNIIIKEGVKLLGDRNVEKKMRGALIYTTESGVHPFFNASGDNVLIYGLTFKGDDGDILVKEDAFMGKTDKFKKDNYLVLYNKNMYATPVSSGIATKNKNLVIDNCELYQWTYTAVYVQKGAENIQIKNSYIHHNQRFGLGYGITIDAGEAFISNNKFDYNRHSIASTGRIGSKYIAENNIFYSNGNNSWAVDMHGGKDRNDGTNIAGDYIIVKNNTFYLTGKGQAVVIRGKSNKTSVVENNTIHLDKSSSVDKEKVFQQVNGKGNFKIFNNVIK